MLGVIARRQLEHGFADPLREPHDRALDHRGRPVHALENPRRIDARQLGGGGEVEIDGHALVALQERRGDVGRDFAFDRARHDPRLMLAGREQGDLFGVENRGDTHRDRLARHVLDAEEIGRGVLAGQRVERDDAGPRGCVGARLVESHVPRLADAEQLEVDPARRVNGLLIRVARFRDALAWGHALGDVHVLLRDVHVREEVLPHVAVIAVGTVGRHRVVLVEIERDDAREIDVPRLVAADQLFIDAQRSTARGEAEHRAPLGARLPLNDLDDPLGHGGGEVRVLGKDDGAEPLAVARALDGRRGRPPPVDGGLGHLHLHFDRRAPFVPHVEPRHRDDQHAGGDDRQGKQDRRQQDRLLRGLRRAEQRRILLGEEHDHGLPGVGAGAGAGAGQAAEHGLNPLAILIVVHRVAEIGQLDGARPPRL